MSRTTPHIITYIVCFFCCIESFAQTGISVKASINRDKIMIGEPVELKLEASVPVGTVAQWFPLDTLQHFEFIEKGAIDTTAYADIRTYRQTLIITSFDSGRWALPSLPFSVGNREYLTDSLPVSVAYSNFDPNQEYHDIKDILEVNKADTRYINWVLLALAILSLAAVVFFLRKKRVIPAVAVIKKPVSRLSPLEEAMQALEALRQGGVSSPAGVKGFHTGINDVLREYLYKRTAVATMEKTSGELMLQLQRLNLRADDFTRLAQVLRMNDAVKFAKYQPAADDNNQALEIIKKSVQELDTMIPK